MNTDLDSLTELFDLFQIPKNHTRVGISNIVACNKDYRSLFINRRLPTTGWSNIQIQNFLYLLSTIDTNTKTKKCF